MPAPFATSVNVVALAVGAFIVFTTLDWQSLDVPLLVALAACAIASDLQAMRTGAA